MEEKKTSTVNYKKNVEFHQIDLSDFKKQNQLIKILEGCKYIFHLAALADIVPSIEKPIIYHRANVNGTINILEAARKNNVEKFIYTASSSCYGIPETVPTSGKSEIKPEYPYALTKYVGEQYALHWNKLYDLPLISLRLFNVYGQRA